jgi:hypothetical protein
MQLGRTLLFSCRCILEKGRSMDTQSAFVSIRRGTPGLDIFKIAGQSISGFLPSFKTGSSDRARQPFTSQLEERLAIFLEYHPYVRSYQRGDASETFARARHLHTPLGTPYRIGYMIFPYFRRVSKHEPVAVHRQQGSDTLTKSGVAADCRTLRSTQRCSFWPPNGSDRLVG